MTIRLRPHHLLCLLTYVGKGYSPAFVANYDSIAERIAAGEAVAIVDGLDDICAPLLHDADAHCRRPGVVDRDDLARAALEPLLGQALTTDTSIDLRPHLADMRKAFADGGPRAACTGCEWFSLCSNVAGGGYEGVRLPT